MTQTIFSDLSCCTFIKFYKNLVIIKKNNKFSKQNLTKFKPKKFNNELNDKKKSDEGHNLSISQ